jgi:hypothetical protein
LTGAVAFAAVSVAACVGALAGVDVGAAGVAGCAGVPGRPACATSAKAAAQSTAAPTISRRRALVRAGEDTVFWFPISN